MIVQKYGGTSVGGPEKVKRIAARLARTRKSGNPVVVVVSAMGDTTDELLDLAHQVTPNPHDRELDMLLSAGERISMALLSMALRDLGQEAISFTGSQAGIITDESHGRARILEIRPTRVLDGLAHGKIVIVAGFQGVSRTKEVTTLGRGGSDTTAVALAAALNADRCEIFTDVPGIFSADPRVVPTALHYDRLPLALVFEMAVKGAQVMHARAIEIARERRRQLFVGLAHPKCDGVEEGTMLVAQTPNMELPKIVAITCKRGLRILRFKPSQAAPMLEELAHDSVLAHNMTLTTDGLAVLVDPTEARSFLSKHEDSACSGLFDAVSLIGYQLQQNTSVASRVMTILSHAGVHVAGLTCHPQSITVWFPASSSDDTCAKAVKILHEALIEGK